MSPTLNPVSSQPPDIVLINKYAAKPEVSSLQIGDVVTLISPIDPNRIITKRILALGGDIVSVGNRLSTRHSSSRGASLEEHEGKDEEEAEHKDKIRIPPFHMWLEGDATALEYRSDGKLEIPSNLKSRDSREFGPVSEREEKRS
jgi:inner membrane protease subunit 2